MKTIEQKTAEIMANAAKEVAKAEKECAIRALLPIDPVRVFVYPLYGYIGTVSYTADTKAEAFQIAQQFKILPAFICRDGSVSIKPFDDKKAKTTQEIYIWVSVDQYKTELEFFAESNSEIIKISIELPQRLFGSYRKSDSRAKLNFTMDWFPLDATNAMEKVITYARAYHRGEQSGHNIIYACTIFEFAALFEGIK
jgi:hypothetical protein